MGLPVSGTGSNWGAAWCLLVPPVGVCLNGLCVLEGVCVVIVVGIVWAVLSAGGGRWGACSVYFDLFVFFVICLTPGVDFCGVRVLVKATVYGKGVGVSN